MVPPGDTVQKYPVIPDSVVYVTLVAPTQTDANPVIVGIGRGFTVTFLTVNGAEVQPLPLV